MGDKVIGFPKAKSRETEEADNDAAMIAELEQLIERVKRGEVAALATCWVNTDLSTGQSYVNTYSAHQLCAAITYLQVQYVAAMVEERMK